MAQFVALTDNVEVTSQTAVSLIESLDSGKSTRRAILEKHGIFMTPGEWYDWQSVLNAQKEILETIGEMNLFLIGKAIIEKAPFPPVQDLKEALNALNVSYHMSHRINGQVMFNEQTGQKLDGIGGYDMVEYDEENKRAAILCDNPYPSKLDEGIITQLARRFKPKGAIKISVTLDLSKESRLTGGDSCTFLVKWN